jgi:hypothetical protein
MGEALCASPSELSQLVESLPELWTELKLPFSTLLLRPLCLCSMERELMEEVLLGTSGGTFLPQEPVEARPVDLPPPLEVLSCEVLLDQFCCCCICTWRLGGAEGEVHGVMRWRSRGGVSCLRPHSVS